MVFLDFQSRAGGFLSVIPAAAKIKQLRPATEQIGALRMLLDGPIDRFQSLVVFSLAFPGSGDTDDRRFVLLWLLGSRLIKLARFLIVAVQPSLPRLPQAVIVSPCQVGKKEYRQTGIRVFHWSASGMTSTRSEFYVTDAEEE